MSLLFILTWQVQCGKSVRMKLMLKFWRFFTKKRNNSTTDIQTNLLWEFDFLFLDQNYCVFVLIFTEKLDEFQKVNSCNNEVSKNLEWILLRKWFILATTRWNLGLLGYILFQSYRIHIFKKTFYLIIEQQ